MYILGYFQTSSLQEKLLSIAIRGPENECPLHAKYIKILYEWIKFIRTAL